MIYHKEVLALLLVALCPASLFFTASLYQVVRKSDFGFSRKSYSSHESYSESSVVFCIRLFNMITIAFVGDDFPPVLPNAQVGEVAMMIEESVRYALTDPESIAEWHSAFPDLRGSLRLGPDDREFFVSMYHEFHCLQQFHETLSPSKSHIAWGHLQHCLNYLRQWSLCQGDLTLEAGDFTTRNFTEDRSGPTHTCRDWEPAMSVVTANWDKWVAHWKELKKVYQPLERRIWFAHYLSLFDRLRN